jgi:diketogulonate reductase-like aldo/keto reductase
VVIPILGAHDADQLAETLGSLEVELDEDQLRRLDEASAVPLGFPHDFMRMMRRGAIASDGALGAIDDHRGSLA